MAEITHQGCREILFNRMFLAVASSIVVQFFFMSCVILITNLSITSPLSWIEDTWSIITCFKMWCYFLVLATVILCQGVVCSKNYLNAPPFVASRFAAFCSLFTPRNFLIGSLYLTIGIVTVWLHLSLEDGKYSSLTKSCSTFSESSCLIEEHLFLLIGGLWTGIYYFTKSNIFGLKQLQFPIIPQSKFSQVKRGISAVLPTAMSSALWPSFYYLCFYYFFGGFIRRTSIITFFLNFEDEPLDKISRLINLTLVFHTWLYASLFALTMNSMHLLFQAHLTEWMQFEISQGVFNTSQLKITLHEALAMDEVPIIQHLGYLDLVNIAEKQKYRRPSLFALSQPGGHPYNWNCIVEKCLGLIKNFSNEINQICSGKQEIESIVANVIPLNVVEKKPYSYQMRNLSAPKTVPAINEVQDVKPVLPSGTFITEFLKTTKQNFVTYLLSKPIIFYFFGTQSDSKIQHLLVNGQPVSWAVDAISSLAVVSLKEDPYGIVQKDLPGIIENLLLLKQSLDKLHKMNLLTRKSHHDDKEMRQMLTSLRSANKRSIYRIVMNFKEYIDDLALEQTTKDQLQNFFSCRE